MPITSSIGITGSVGRGGRNSVLDVKAVQGRLNELMGSSRTHLVVDGKNGPKTEGMIADFQTAVLGFSRPDSRVDPAGKTIGALNDPASASKWQRMSLGSPAAAGGANDPQGRATALLKAEADKAGMGPEWETFRRTLIDEHIPTFKVFLGGISRSDDARKVIEAWKQLRRWGLSPADARLVMTRISGMRGFRASVGLLDEIGKPASKLGHVIGGLGSGASLAGNLVTLVEVADKFEQGDYLFGATELYKHFMGKAIPWAGMVEGLQGLVEAVAPRSATNSNIFQLVRACDPIGLGASAVDSMTTLVLGGIHAIQTGQLDMARLSRLVTRLKTGPTRVFAEMGDALGDSLFEMSRWRRSDWSYAVRQIPGFLMSI